LIPVSGLTGNEVWFVYIFRIVNDILIDNMESLCVEYSHFVL